MERVLQSALIGKDEIFNVLALGESLQLPILLVGDRGTAKTQAVLDYVGGSDKAFTIQLSQGTRANEIKGTVDMESYVKHHEFKTISPIVDAEAVIIDEVDKAFGGVRDMLLSIMRERKLFLGSEGTKDCKWKVFAGCCNEIPESEKNSPFWDRFIIRYQVPRLPEEVIKKHLNSVLEPRELRMPLSNGDLKAEIEKLNPKHLRTVLKLAYKTLSDRTIFQLPRIIAASKKIWGISEEEAVLKMASLVLPSIIPKLQETLFPKEVAEIKQLIATIQQVVDAQQLAVVGKNIIDKIKGSGLSAAEKNAFGIALKQDYEAKLKELQPSTLDITKALGETNGDNPDSC